MSRLLQVDVGTEPALPNRLPVAQPVEQKLVRSEFFDNYMCF